MAWDRDTSVGIVAKRRAELLTNRGSIPSRFEIFPKCRPTVGIKRPGHEADHSRRSSAKVKNEWSSKSTPLHAFVTCIAFFFSSGFAAVRIVTVHSHAVAVSAGVGLHHGFWHRRVSCIIVSGSYIHVEVLVKLSGQTV